MFGTVQNLAVPVLLGKYFIDTFIEGILSDETKIIPFNFPPLLILMVHEAGPDKTEEQ